MTAASLKLGGYPPIASLVQMPAQATVPLLLLAALGAMLEAGPPPVVSSLPESVKTEEPKISFTPQFSETY